MISRDKYLQKLISKQRNGLVKVITGIRRSGKSFLLFKIFVDYLKSSGVTDDQIIMLALDDDENIKYRNPIELGKYLRELAYDQNKQYYILLDEIQQVAIIKNPYTDDKDDKISFVNVVNGLMRHDNIDVYIIGSNSEFIIYFIIYFNIYFNIYFTHQPTKNNKKSISTHHNCVRL